MTNFLKIISCLILLSIVGCKSSDALSSFTLDRSQTVVFSGKTFMFKNYYFTYKNGQATLVYLQDLKLSSDAEPIFLALKENKNSRKYQEFTDSSKSIVVKVINKNEVRLQLDKARHTLYNAPIDTEISIKGENILADIAHWKENYH